MVFFLTELALFKLLSDTGVYGFLILCVSKNLVRFSYDFPVDAAQDSPCITLPGTR